MIKVLKEVSKKELKQFIYDIDLNDQSLYKELNNDNRFGIFQMDGNTASGLVKEIKPKDFNEVCIVNAAARPGTIDFVKDYILSRDRGIKKYPKPVVDATKETEGVIFYQEQVMAVFNKVGGFTLEETNEVRSLMKKLGKADKKQSDLDKWDVVVNKFKAGAIEKGLTGKEAEMVADDLLKLSAYSFNKSHSVAYAYMAMINLYMSVYFRPYFYSATLAYTATKKDALQEAINICKQNGYEICPPDIEKSKVHFYPDGNKIIFGLNEIKGVGLKTALSIISNKPYTDIFDFIVRSGCNKTVLKALNSVGVFNKFHGGEIDRYNYIFDEFSEKSNTKVIEKKKKIFDDIVKEAFLKPDLVTQEAKLVEYEKEYYGFNMFHSMFTTKLQKFIFEANKKGYCEVCLEEISDYHTSARVPLLIENIRVINDKNGNEMAFVDAFDMYGANANFPIFQGDWKFVKEAVKDKGVFLLNVFKNEDGKIMFGSKKRLSDEEKKRLAKKIN